MPAFFSITKDVECIDVSLAMASALAKKAKKKQTLYLSSSPVTAALMHPMVDIRTDLPKIFNSYRRAVHENVITDNEKLYFNLWPYHLRGHYCNRISIEPLSKLLAKQAEDSRIRNGKNISLKDILFSGPTTLRKSKLAATSFRKSVIMSPRALNVLQQKNIDLRTITGSLDSFNFYILSPKKWSARNVRWVSEDDYFAALSRSDVFVMERPSESMWYNNFTYKKKLVSLLDGDAEADIVSCLNISYASDDYSLLSSVIKNALL